MFVMYSICSGVCPGQLFCSAWTVVSRGAYIDVCYCVMSSVVNVYLDHLEFSVVCMA